MLEDPDYSSSSTTSPTSKGSPTDSETSEGDFDYNQVATESQMSQNIDSKGLGLGVRLPSSASTSSYAAYRSESGHQHQSPIITNPSPPKTSIQQRSSRPSRPLTSLSAININTNNNTSNLPRPPSISHGHLPKSQPLARALFTRMASNGSSGLGCGLDVPHAGMGKQRLGGGGSQKLIVPTKGFRTTFELGLTSSEFARK